MHFAALLLAAVHAIELHPLSPSFGLEVRGIRRDDLRSKKAQKTLRDAFAASRGLLLLRGLRGLSCDELITLSSVFGDVEAAPADGSYETLVDEAGRVHEFSTVPSSGVFQGRADDTNWQYDAETGKPSWHTDQSFRSPRPLASAMYCLETPGDGVGQTVFCSTVAACEDLPARVRSRLAKLRAAHSYEQLSASFQRFAGGTTKTLTGARKEALYHLVDDGALYLAPHAISNVVDETGKELAKGSELVDALAARCTRPEYVHAHAWEVGDVVVWNNLRTMHAATGVPESAAKRRMWRTTALPRAGGGDDDTDATVTVPASAARAVATAALERSGSGRLQAAAAADAFVAAEVDGRAAHGLRRIPEVCDALERGDISPNPEVRVLMDQKSVVVRCVEIKQ
jgi:taurine dioxygenase